MRVSYRFLPALLISAALSISVALSSPAPFAGPAGAAAQPAPPPVDWKPGEVIVLFSPASSAAAAVRAALHGRLQEEPALIEAVGALSRELALPLTARQVLSGGEVLLEIDRAALGSRLAEKLREDPRVAAVTVVEPKEESPFRDPRAEVTATLAPSAEVTAILAAARRAPEGCSAALDELAAALTGDLDLPFRARATGEAEVTFAIDLRELTRLLAERLREQPSVEAVEFNKLLRVR